MSKLMHDGRNQASALLKELGVGGEAANSGKRFLLPPATSLHALHFCAISVHQKEKCADFLTISIQMLYNELNKEICTSSTYSVIFPRFRMNNRIQIN